MPEKEFSAEEFARKEMKRLLDLKFTKFLQYFGYYEVLMRLRGVEETERLLAKYSYLLLRYADDVGDGDHPDFTKREDQKKELINILGYVSNPYDQQAVSVTPLYDEIISLFSEKGVDDEVVITLFSQAIVYIQYDFDRSSLEDVQPALSKTDLDRYFYNAFKDSVNILCYGLGQQKFLVPDELKFEENGEPILERLQALCYAQGQLYSIRDLHIDWPRNIKNIPAEVLKSARLTTESSYEEVVNNRFIHFYFLRQTEKMEKALDTLTETIKDLSHPEARFMCMQLVKKMKRIIAENYKKFSLPQILKEKPHR